MANSKLLKEERPWGDGPCPAKDSWLKTKFKRWGFNVANIEKNSATREIKSQHALQILESHKPPSQEILFDAVRIMLKDENLLQWLSDQYWDQQIKKEVVQVRGQQQGTKDPKLRRLST